MLDAAILARYWAKRPTLLPLLAIAVVCVLFLALWAGGRPAVPLEGTVQTGPEQSAFFPDGDCSRKPFWFNWPHEFDYDMNAKIRGLEYPDALRVKLIGNLSRLGKYGHLGGPSRSLAYQDDFCHACPAVLAGNAEKNRKQQGSSNCNPLPEPSDRSMLQVVPSLHNTLDGQYERRDDEMQRTTSLAGQWRS